MKGKTSDVDHPEAAFTLGDGDRFHSILVSDGIRFEQDPHAETILTFFIVRRASGLHDLYHVLKTFKGDKCVSRQVQRKLDIPPAGSDQELPTSPESSPRGSRTPLASR